MAPDYLKMIYGAKTVSTDELLAEAKQMAASGFLMRRFGSSSELLETPHRFRGPQQIGCSQPDPLERSIETGQDQMTQSGVLGPIDSPLRGT